MSFQVRELAKAKADKRRIFEWLIERSRSGAIAWLAAYDKMIQRHEANADTCGAAFENAELEMEVRQALFKTAKGRMYRALFVIELNEVFILRVRGPGQASVDGTEIDSPQMPTDIP